MVRLRGRGRGPRCVLSRRDDDAYSVGYAEESQRGQGASRPTATNPESHHDRLVGCRSLEPRQEGLDEALGPLRVAVKVEAGFDKLDLHHLEGVADVQPVHPRVEQRVTARQRGSLIGLGAQVVAVSIDNKPGNALGYAEEAGLGLTVWWDGPKGLAATLDLPAVPTSYVLDRDGNVVLRIVGSSEKDLHRMRQTVQSLLGEVKKGPEA